MTDEPTIERLFWATVLGGLTTPAEWENQHSVGYGVDVFNDRWLVNTEQEATLVSSLTRTGQHAPILDLDYQVELKEGIKLPGGREYAVELPPKLSEYLLNYHSSVVGCPEHPLVTVYDGGNGLAGLAFDCAARLVPSRTGGHFHLFLEEELTWKSYACLLDWLADASIIEPGYVSQSLRLGMSFLRVNTSRDGTTG